MSLLDIMVCTALGAADATNFAEPRGMPSDPLVSKASLVSYSANPAYQRLDYQWYVKNSGLDSVLYLNGQPSTSGKEVGGGYDLALEGAWEVSDESSIKICIIDTGVNYRHPDLACVTFRGINTVSDTDDPMDLETHGTQLAGVLFGCRNNNLGVAGLVRPRGEVLVVATDYSEAAIAKGLAYAITNGAQIINCSWGFKVEPVSLKPLFDEAARLGIVLVCAAPNYTTDLDAKPDWPAAWQLPNVIVVGGVDRAGKTCASGTGTNLVHCAAPSRTILTTYNGPGDYCYVSGTSFSVAMFTGCLALTASHYAMPVLDSAEWLLQHCERDQALKVRYGRLTMRTVLTPPPFQLSVEQGLITWPPTTNAVTIHRSLDNLKWEVYQTNLTTRMLAVPADGFYRASQ
jgi:thermitase